MVLRILLTKWSSYPDMQLSNQLLGLRMKIVFFSCFLFFFSFYLLSLEAFSNFPHFFISFSNWFLCSSQAFDCNTLRTSNSSSCYSCNMNIIVVVNFLSQLIFIFPLFLGMVMYSMLMILKQRKNKNYLK